MKHEVDTSGIQRKMLAVPPVMSLQVNPVPVSGIIVYTLRTQVTTNLGWEGACKIQKQVLPRMQSKKNMHESVSF